MALINSQSIRIIATLLLFYVSALDVTYAASVPVEQDWLDVGDGLISYDSDTGLEWLDLSVTEGMSYAEAKGFVNGLDSTGGWKYPSNEQINDLFWAMFPNYVDSTENGFAGSIYDNAYAGIESDVIRFQSLFGPAFIGNQFNDYSYSTTGYYMDESGVIRRMGTYMEDLAYSSDRYAVFGVDFTAVYTETDNITSYATFLVRDSVVPIPAAIWLFGSGLIGLIGLARREKL